MIVAVWPAARPCTRAKTVCEEPAAGAATLSDRGTNCAAASDELPLLNAQHTWFVRDVSA